MNLQSYAKKLLILFLIFTFFLFSYGYADDIDPEEDVLDISTEFEQALSLNTSSDNSDKLNLNSRSCVVLDRKSKYILYEKNAYNKVKMASTTKIMTAIIVIENANLNTTVEVSKKAANTGGSRLGLKTGDKITIHDLLYGLMLCSGNDAAVCLAENVGGSIDGFANLMNKKATELSLKNTHFESPHGLDSDMHYTTAYELSLLTDYALKNSTFSQIVGTKNYTITLNGYPKSIHNTNELLGNLNGVYGVKTGFTNGANRCLVSSCKRDDMDIICVVLGADTKSFRTKDSIKLIEYCFANFEYLNVENLITKSLEDWKITHYLNPFYIDKGTSNNLTFSIGKISYPLIPIKKDLKSNIKTKIEINTNLCAPVYENTNIGKIDVLCNDEVIYTVNIFTDNFIDKKGIYNYMISFFKSYPLLLESFIK